MKSHLYKLALKSVLLSGVLSLSSCEKVIDIDLNSADPQLVVEAKVTDQLSPHRVQLTKTVNFDQPNVFPKVTGATVTLSDNLGNTEVLTEVTPGIYESATLSGVPGRNYFLKVEAEGKEYVAQSSLAPPVPIDTIYSDSISFGGNATFKYVNVEFTDPEGIENYYRILEIINGDTLNIINITNDEFDDGEKITFSVFSDQDPELESGDNVEIILLTIDENVYNYFRGLIEVINNGGQSAAPANPVNNLSNGALGYFSAHSVTKKSFIVP